MGSGMERKPEIPWRILLYGHGSAGDSCKTYSVFRSVNYYVNDALWAICPALTGQVFSRPMSITEMKRVMFLSFPLKELYVDN